jgi:hypothetical protein
MKVIYWESVGVENMHRNDYPLLNIVFFFTNLSIFEEKPPRLSLRKCPVCGLRQRNLL